jgi:hypothetical protein
MKYVLALILIPNLAFGFSSPEIPKTPPYNYKAVKGVTFDGKAPTIADEVFHLDFGTAKLLFRTA